MRTHTIYFHAKENRKKIIPIVPPDLALLLTLTSSNYLCLEHTCVSMVPKVFEPSMFYCTIL